MTGIDENLLKKNLKLLAKAVGDENAMQMVKDVPKILEFNGDNFQAVMNAYKVRLGDEVAIATVLRNPALISVPPTGYGGADQGGQDTVILSYVVAATRPLGGLWLSLLLLVLATPAIELITGIEIRSAILPDIFRDLKFI